MIVFLRFLAFSNQLSCTFTPFSLPDDSTAEVLLSAIERNWKEAGIGTEEERSTLPHHTLLASDGRMLRQDDLLHEGQRISIIGQIIGG